MDTNYGDEHERSAAGLDHEDRNPYGDTAASLGSRMIDEGPEALFQEIENMLPESWREQIRQFPIVAVALGVGVGVWLGMRKGDEVIAAGSSMISAAALANVSGVMERIKQG
jgi:hypothetical protein